MLDHLRLELSQCQSQQNWGRSQLCLYYAGLLGIDQPKQFLALQINFIIIASKWRGKGGCLRTDSAKTILTLSLKTPRHPFSSRWPMLLMMRENLWSTLTRYGDDPQVSWPCSWGTELIWKPVKGKINLMYKKRGFAMCRRKHKMIKPPLDIRAMRSFSGCQKLCFKCQFQTEIVMMTL